MKNTENKDNLLLIISSLFLISLKIFSRGFIAMKIFAWHFPNIYELTLVEGMAAAVMISVFHSTETQKNSNETLSSFIGESLGKTALIWIPLLFGYLLTLI